LAQFCLPQLQWVPLVCLCCSCAFVIFCVISVGCCWFVSVLPWFIFCPRLKKNKVTLQRRVMIQNLSNLTKKLPLRSITM
jgi:hypothetical protein